MRESQKITIFILNLLLLASYSVVFAQGGAGTQSEVPLVKGYQLTVPIPIPGRPAVTEIVDATQYIKTIYQFGLGIGALIALGTIIFAAIVYIVQQGNVARQLDAKDMILNAIWGLVLLFSATLILFTIDPRLVKPETLVLPTTKLKSPLATSDWSRANQENKVAKGVEKEKKQARDTTIDKYFPGIPITWKNDPQFPTYVDAFKKLKDDENLTPKQICDIKIEIAKANLEWYQAGQNGWQTAANQQHEKIKEHEALKPGTTLYESAVKFPQQLFGETDYDLWQNSMNRLQEALRNFDKNLSDARENTANAQQVYDEVVASCQGKQINEKRD